MVFNELFYLSHQIHKRKPPIGGKEVDNDKKH